MEYSWELTRVLPAPFGLPSAPGSCCDQTLRHLGMLSDGWVQLRADKPAMVPWLRAVDSGLMGFFLDFTLW